MKEQKVVIKLMTAKEVLANKVRRETKRMMIATPYKTLHHGSNETSLISIFQ
jgi:hypothetical protein